MTVSRHSVAGKLPAHPNTNLPASPLTRKKENSNPLSIPMMTVIQISVMMMMIMMTTRAQIQIQTSAKNQPQSHPNKLPNPLQNQSRKRKKSQKMTLVIFLIPTITSRSLNPRKHQQRLPKSLPKRGHTLHHLLPPAMTMMMPF